MKHQLHASGLEGFARCGIWYYRRHVCGEKTPPSARAATGTAVHRSVHLDLTQKKDAGELLPLEQVQDISRDALVKEWDYVQLTDEDRDDGLSRDRAIDTAVSLAVLHHRLVAPALKPTHLERSWVLDVAALDVQVAGKLDIQQGLESIRDVKTSSKSPQKDLAHNSLQLSTYSLAVRQLDGKLPKMVALDYLVETPKRRDTKWVPLESIRTDAHLEPVLARVQRFADILRTGSFAPAEVGHWFCSGAYCPFHPGAGGDCKYAARPVSVPVKDDLVDKLEASLQMAAKEYKLWQQTHTHLQR